MKRFAFAVAIVAMAAASCARGEQRGTTDTTQMMDTMPMTDTTKMTPPDTTKQP